MTFRQRYNRQISFYYLIALALHIPFFMGLAYANDKGLLLAVGLSLFFLVGPAALYISGVTSALLPCVLAFTTISYSGLLIHFGNGMIEMHFHIFIVLAAFIAFGLRAPVLVGVVTTAVHHIAFFFLLPASVFNYKASFGIVLLHATFVILEAVPVLYVATRFKRLIDLQDSTVGEIENISLKLSTTAESIASSGRGLAEASSNSAGAVRETAASLEELNSTVQLTAKHAHDAADLSQESKTSAENGDREVQHLIKSMDKISSSSKKIGEIINVIDDIAFQTNLLALNAAVEAARAGEQGRGFAVVAEAVRALAQRSASAATDIRHLIKDSVNTIEAGASAAQQSGQVLNAIVQSVHRVTDLVGEIAVATKEQSNGISQISLTMNSLDTASRKNAESSTTVSLSVAEIQEYSKRMKSLVEEFNKELGIRDNKAS